MLLIQFVERNSQGLFVSQLVHGADDRITVRLTAPSLSELKILTLRATGFAAGSHPAEDLANVDRIDVLWNRMSIECQDAEDLQPGETLAYRATA